MASKSKKFFIHSQGEKNYVEVCSSDNLSDVRKLILEEFDEEQLPISSPQLSATADCQFSFKVDGVRISAKQECRNLAFDLLTQEAAVELVPKKAVSPNHKRKSVKEYNRDIIDLTLKTNDGESENISKNVSDDANSESNCYGNSKRAKVTVHIADTSEFNCGNLIDGTKLEQASWEDSVQVVNPSNERKPVDIIDLTLKTSDDANSKNNGCGNIKRAKETGHVIDTSGGKGGNIPDGTKLEQVSHGDSVEKINTEDQEVCGVISGGSNVDDNCGKDASKDVSDEEGWRTRAIRIKLEQLGENISTEDQEVGGVISDGSNVDINRAASVLNQSNGKSAENNENWGEGHNRENASKDLAEKGVERIENVSASKPNEETMEFECYGADTTPTDGMNNDTDSDLNATPEIGDTTRERYIELTSERDIISNCNVDCSDAIRSMIEHNQHKDVVDAKEKSNRVLDQLVTILEEGKHFFSDDHMDKLLGEIQSIREKSSPRTMFGVLGGTGV